MLLRMADAEISGRLARAMDVSADDGGSFMVGLINSLICVLCPVMMCLRFFVFRVIERILM